MLWLSITALVQVFDNSHAYFEEILAGQREIITREIFAQRYYSTLLSQLQKAILLSINPYYQQTRFNIFKSFSLKCQLSEWFLLHLTNSVENNLYWSVIFICFPSYRTIFPNFPITFSSTREFSFWSSAYHKETKVYVFEDELFISQDFRLVRWWRAMGINNSKTLLGAHQVFSRFCLTANSQINQMLIPKGGKSNQIS